MRFLAILALPAALALECAAPAPRTIAQIQGGGFSTPFPSTTVETTGIVTADFQDEPRQGFFLQDPVGDSRLETSEGIFVAERRVPVRRGDEVKVIGRVRENFELTVIDQVTSITVLSSGNSLPPAVELHPPFGDSAAAQYFEALEGMRVSVSAAKAVSGTDRFGEFAAIREELSIDRVFRDDPAGTGERILVDDGGGVSLSVKSRDRLRGLEGVLDYTFGNYKVVPSRESRIEILESYDEPLPDLASSGGFSIATFNVENLFDTQDDPGKSDTVESAPALDLKLSKLAAAIHHFLQEPALVALEEVEKIELLHALAGRAAIEAPYGAVLIEGADERGIDIGLLYRRDRVSEVIASQAQGCTSLRDGLGPDGGGTSCDTDGNGTPDGNRLFDRPPLVVDLLADGVPLTVIANHFKSKSEDTRTSKVTTPRRTAQAEFVGRLVQERLAEEPGRRIVVLGDLNDYEDEPPLVALERAGLRNLVLSVPKADRYTFVFGGVSQVLDHILVTPALEPAFRLAAVRHFNVDFPDPRFGPDPSSGRRSSDHDPVVAYFALK